MGDASKRNWFPVYTLTAWGTAYTLWALHKTVIISGRDHVEKDRPFIIASTHSNMIIDPACLINYTPHARQHHFWAKSSLFAHPVTRAIFNGLGAVSVDRSTKQNNGLFEETVAALARNRMVTIFPEGTSYTKPGMLDIKDGMSFALLAYEQWRQKMREVEGDESFEEAAILPVAITYLDKTAWRGDVIVSFCEPVTLTRDLLQACKEEPKQVARQISAFVAKRMEQNHVTARTWEAIRFARVAWEVFHNDGRVGLEQYIRVNRTVIDVLERRTGAPTLHAATLTLGVYEDLLRMHQLCDRQVRFNAGRLASNALPTLLYFLLVSLCILPLFLYHLPLHLVERAVTKRQAHAECISQNKGFIVLWLAPLLYAVYAFAAAYYSGVSWAVGLVPLLYGGVPWTYLSLVDRWFSSLELSTGYLSWMMRLSERERTILAGLRRDVRKGWDFVCHG